MRKRERERERERERVSTQVDNKEKRIKFGILLKPINPGTILPGGFLLALLFFSFR